MQLPIALTFDDVLLLPGYSEIIPSQAKTNTRLGSIELAIPLLSAAMDTVTESAMARLMAEYGGIGVIHKNLSIHRQVQEVTKVKKSESGVVLNPETIEYNASIADLFQLYAAHNITGVPVVDEQQNLVGIVTNRDVRFVSDLSRKVEDVMTPKSKLITTKSKADKASMKKLLHENRIEKLLVVDDDFKLVGMVTASDLLKEERHPLATKDEQGRLRVGAAVGTGQKEYSRALALINAGVDMLVIDTAHGHSKGVISALSKIKKNFPKIVVVAGNIATADGAKALADAGADVVKVGIGPGSICTTRIVAGIGVPQISAIQNAVAGRGESGVQIIADGGIRYSGDISKAIAAGADAVMAGSLLAGTDESPGEVEIYQGKSYKQYRGMGSLGAMSEKNSSKDRYFQDEVSEIEKLVPEGIEGRVAYRGSVGPIIHQLMGGLRASLGYTGCADLAELQTKAKMVQITQAGVRESHAHDVNITKEAPNYFQH